MANFKRMHGDTENTYKLSDEGGVPKIVVLNEDGTEKGHLDLVTGKLHLGNPGAMNTDEMETATRELKISFRPFMHDLVELNEGFSVSSPMGTVHSQN